jgi:hypothetical protein
MGSGCPRFGPLWWIFCRFSVDLGWILCRFVVDLGPVFMQAGIRLFAFWGRFVVDLGSIWPGLLTTAGVVSLEVCLVGPQATSNRTSEDENTVGIGCRHRRSSCDWTRDFILRRILPLTYRIPHLTCDPRRLILYLISHLIRHIIRPA